MQGQGWCIGYGRGPSERSLPVIDGSCFGPSDTCGKGEQVAPSGLRMHCPFSSRLSRINMLLSYVSIRSRSRRRLKGWMPIVNKLSNFYDRFILAKFARAWYLVARRCMRNRVVTLNFMSRAAKKRRLLVLRLWRALVSRRGRDKVATCQCSERYRIWMLKLFWKKWKQEFHDHRLDRVTWQERSLVNLHHAFVFLHRYLVSIHVLIFPMHSICDVPSEED